MIIKNLGISILLVAAMATSCQSPAEKDAAAKVKIEKALPAGAVVTVKDGVATITGNFATAEEREKALKDAKATAGVKTVVDQSALESKVPESQPVMVHGDEQLNADIQTILIAHPTVKATAKDGVVVLTGSLERSKLPQLMQELNAAHPKKIENQLELK